MSKPFWFFGAQTPVFRYPGALPRWNTVVYRIPKRVRRKLDHRDRVFVKKFRSWRRYYAPGVGEEALAFLRQEGIPLFEEEVEAFLQARDYEWDPCLPLVVGDDEGC